MKRLGFVLMAAALLLAGCSNSLTDSFTFLEPKEKPIKRDLFPADFKQQFLHVVPSIVAEQRGIRDAYYSDPVLDPSANTYASCVRFNPRDGAGQYLGNKEYVVYYYNGVINQVVPGSSEQCRAASYKPFPELEKLCAGPKC
jgi:hypothetical protein